MVRGPLPGERLFAWPASEATRRLLRFAAWLGAVVWFLSPPAVLAGFLFNVLPVIIAVPLWFAAWIAGLILLGRAVRGLAPLQSAEPARAV